MSFFFQNTKCISFLVKIELKQRELYEFCLKFEKWVFFAQKFWEIPILPNTQKWIKKQLSKIS
jgi:hypothetical protein